MNIVTLTLNPAFDLHCYVKDFQPYHENLAELTDWEAGGKGINISRALTVNGVDHLAVVLLGSENGANFEAALKKDCIPYSAISVPGRIRENITLHTDHADETRISFRGFSADCTVLEKVEKELSFLRDGDIVTLTGRNPEGMEISDVKEFLKRLKTRGIRIVVDSRSFTLADLVEVKPWLIKPNQEEVSAYLCREINCFENVKAAAQNFHLQGIENVMISLGAQGAFLVCSEGEFQVPAPKINAVSTVGAGDSSIAGFLAAAKANQSAQECLRLAVAYGSAACLTPGTRPPLPEDIYQFLK